MTKTTTAKSIAVLSTASASAMALLRQSGSVPAGSVSKPVKNAWYDALDAVEALDAALADERKPQ